MQQTQDILLPKGDGQGWALQERLKDHVANPSASPAAACCKNLPQDLHAMVTYSPGPWKPPVPVSSSLEVEVFEKRRSL